MEFKRVGACTWTATEEDMPYQVLSCVIPSMVLVLSKPAYDRPHDRPRSNWVIPNDVHALRPGVDVVKLSLMSNAAVSINRS